MSTSALVLLKARRAAGLSQRAVAEAAGVRQPLICRIETGREQPGVLTLTRLVAACGFSLRLELEAAPDRGDLTLLESTLRLTPEERVDRLLALHRVALELQEATRRALTVRDA
jgi:transcriptional regulator with XRE-family HTH domain